MDQRRRIRALPKLSPQQAGHYKSPDLEPGSQGDPMEASALDCGPETLDQMFGHPNLFDLGGRESTAPCFERASECGLQGMESNLSTRLSSPEAHDTFRCGPIAAQHGFFSPQSESLSQDLKCTRSALGGNRAPHITANIDCDIQGRLLRCPYWFDGSAKPCSKTHKVIRDLIRHLEGHGYFFCPKCGQAFTDRYQLRRHACDNRMCVDLFCPNRPLKGHEHQWRIGCRANFNALDTPGKWYALHALQLLTPAKPPWQDVLMAGKKDSPFRATTSTPSSTSPMSSQAFCSPGSTVTSGRSISDTLGSPTSLDSSDRHDQEFSGGALSYLEAANSVVFPQVATLIRGGVQQNRMILAHDEQLRHLDDQLRHFQRKLMELQNAIFASTAQKTQIQDSRTIVEEMEVDEAD